MVIIELRFTAGRFHATPWGRHVNEGVPEWPPSPFRLLRALYDVWRRKAADAPEEEVEALLALLASTAPDFALPRAGASHTRLYLRQGKEDETDKKLVFDPFVVVMPSDPICIGWPSLTLSEPQAALLNRLLRQVNYLGRTESLADARLGDDSQALAWNCRPIDRGAPMANGSSARQEIVQVACVAAPGTHVPVETKKGKGKKKPLEWFEALTWGSAEMLAMKLSDPPALRWVSYQRAHDALELPPVPHARSVVRPVDSVLFSLSGKVLPLVTDTILVAERVRVSAMGASRRIGGGDPACVSQLLSGKDANGKPLEGHRHAHYMPLDRDQDGRIDHILIRCAQGLGHGEQVALAGVRALWQSKGRPNVQLVPVASGMAGDILEHGRLWISATPFVTPRHHKPSRGPFDAWIEAELRRSLQHAGLPEPSRIERIDRLELSGGRSKRWIEFRRARKDDSPRLGFGFRMEFPQDVMGPFAVGYGSHFGLGAFRSA